MFLLDFIRKWAQFTPSPFNQALFHLQRLQRPRPSRSARASQPLAAAAHRSMCRMKAARRTTFPTPSLEAPSPWSTAAAFAFCPSCTSDEALGELGQRSGNAGLRVAARGGGLMPCGINRHQQTLRYFCRVKRWISAAVWAKY